MANITLKNLSEKTRIALASDTNISKEGLYELSKDSDWRVLYHLCYNPSTPDDIRIQLIKNKDPVTEYIAKRKENSVEVFSSLIMSENPTILEETIKNPSFPIKSFLERIKEIIKTHFIDEHVMAEIARNKNTPEEILDLLYNSEFIEVRCNVAENTNTSKNTLNILADDDKYYVKCSVAANPSADPKTLRKLFSSTEHNYIYRYNYLSCFCDINVNLASNTSSPENVLMGCCKIIGEGYKNIESFKYRGQEDIRAQINWHTMERKIAANPSLTIKMVKYFLHEKLYKTCDKITKTNTNKEILSFLKSNKNPQK